MKTNSNGVKKSIILLIIILLLNTYSVYRITFNVYDDKR